MLQRTAMALGAVIAAVAIGLPAAGADEPPENELFKVACDSVASAGTPLVRGFNCRTVEVQGYPRIYIVYVPRNPEFKLTKKAPLVLGQHGSNGSGGNFMKTSGWLQLAESEGILLAFGTALEASVIAEGGHVETRWNSYGQEDQIDPDVKPAGYPPTADWPADDVGFIQAILDDVDETAKPNRKRIFATGFSNGASFTARVGIEVSDVVAISGFGGSLSSVVPVPEPIPYLLGFGNDDHNLAPAAERPLPLDPAGWGAYPKWTNRIESTVGSWGATGEPDRTTIGPPTTLLEWDSPAALRIALIDGIGHDYFDGAEVLSWEFFEAQSK